MTQSKARSPRSSAALQPYVLSVVTVAAAVGAALLLSYLNVRDMEVPVILFAIALVAWFGGTRAAVLALVLSCTSFDYFFVEPFYSFYVSRADVPYFTAFASFALLLMWFSAIRRNAEEKLSGARDALEIEVAERTQQASLLDLTHDTIFVRDMSDAITYWNRGAEELYGWTPKQAIGAHAIDLLKTVGQASLDEIRAELLRTGRWDGELYNRKSDGTPVVVSSRWSLRRDDRGRPAAILETNNDVTDQKRREQEVLTLNRELGKRTAELEVINKELEAFAYSVSHDLRAPLRHIAGFTELLTKHAAPRLDEKSQRYLATILDSGKRMGELIDDLLAFSRIGRAESHQTQVDLHELVEEAVKEVHQQTDGRDIRWTIGSLPAWYGDRSMLRLVFVNLIANAAKFTRTRPRAEIEIGCTSEDEDRVTLFIHDNGVGFDMKYVGKLFGVFQRLHPSEAFEGTGIGLATVQRIVHRHGGKIWAEGLVDGGATFHFSLARPQGADR